MPENSAAVREGSSIANKRIHTHIKWGVCHTFWYMLLSPPRDCYRVNA